MNSSPEINMSSQSLNVDDAEKYLVYLNAHLVQYKAESTLSERRLEKVTKVSKRHRAKTWSVAKRAKMYRRADRATRNISNCQNMILQIEAEMSNVSSQIRKVST